MANIHGNKLFPCPNSPNCVCSDSREKRHSIEPYQLNINAEKAWTVLKEVISSLPRTTITSTTKDYLHAEARSRVFRFVDDLEFHLRPPRGIIAVRSAARLGYYDFGVNRRRVEKIRARLRARGVVQ